MKKLYPIVALLSVCMQTTFAQSQPVPVQAVMYNSITASSRLDGCDAVYPCIDNRSSATRRSNYSAFRAFGTGTWSVTMQYADTTPTNFISYGSTAVVTQAGPTSGIGYGLDPTTPSKPYHDYIRFVIVGSATIENYFGTKNAWWSPSVAGISYPLTGNQGGTSGLFSPDVFAGSLSAGCTAAASAGLTLLITQAWAVTTGFTCAANAYAYAGGIITVSANQTLTFSKDFHGTVSQHFVTSASNSSVKFTGPVDRVYPQYWGALGDNSHDDTVAVKACIYAVSLVGLECYMPTGEYLITAITLPTPTLNDWHVMRLVGAGHILNSTAGLYGTIIHCTTSTDCLSVTAPAFADNTYDFRDFTMLGNGSSSGHGLYICCGATAVPQVLMNNVSFLQFKGAAKYALYLDGPEDSNLTNVWVSESTACAFLGGAFNANTVVNFSCSGATATYGVELSSVESLSWIGGLFQTNQHYGLRLHGVSQATFVSTHFENNNVSATAGQGAILFDSTGGVYNQHVHFVGGVLNAPQDHVRTANDTTANNSNNKFSDVYAAAVANPIFSLDAYTSGWNITDTVATCSQITDAGSFNRINYRNQTISCGANAAQDFEGKVGINLGNNDPTSPLDIAAATGAEAIRIGAAAAGSYGYIREVHNGGGEGLVFGGNWISAGETNLATTDTRNPWWGMTAILQLWSRTYAQMAALVGIQANNGSMVYCSDCNAGCTAGGSTGQRCFRVNGAWTN